MLKTALDLAKKGIPVALVLRHAGPEGLPGGMRCDEAHASRSGLKAARELGIALGNQLTCCHASPYPRCVETGETIVTGSGQAVGVVKDRLLGNPSVFIDNLDDATEVFERIGHDAVFEHLVNADPLPGWTNPLQASRRLVKHLLDTCQLQGQGVGVFVTHDLTIGVMVRWATDWKPDLSDLPGYLEGALVYRENGQVLLRYRSHLYPCIL
jgi:broad specificity phosphatase PhoE